MKVFLFVFVLSKSEAFKKRLTVKIYKKHEVCSVPPRSETQWAAYKWALLWQAFPLPSMHSPGSNPFLQTLEEQLQRSADLGPPILLQSNSECCCGTLRTVEVTALPDSHCTSDQQCLEQAPPSSFHPPETAEHTAEEGSWYPAASASRILVYGRHWCCAWGCAVPSSASICSCSCWAVLGEGSHCICILMHQTAKLQDSNHHKGRSISPVLMGTWKKWTRAVFSEAENKRMLKIGEFVVWTNSKEQILHPWRWRDWEGDACLRETISIIRVEIQLVMKVMQDSDNWNNQKLWLWQNNQNATTE